MHPDFFGDSFDLVKRFFCQELSGLGYNVKIDGMFTGIWNGKEQDFLKLIALVNTSPNANAQSKSALFIDPDIGANAKGSKKHVSFQSLAAQAQSHKIVFSFDQAFSRQAKAKDVMHQKLAEVEKLGCHGIYYNSHAKFLFVSRDSTVLQELKSHMVSVGLPAFRLFESDG